MRDIGYFAIVFRGSLVAFAAHSHGGGVCTNLMP